MFKILKLIILSIFICNSVYCRGISRRSTYRNCASGLGGENCDIQCGKVKANSKIVGGEIVADRISPSTVYLIIRYAKDDNPSQTFTAACGGTLIDQNTILTAAHCVPQKSNNAHLSDVFAFFGVNNVANAHPEGSFDPPGLKVKIDKIIVHEKYDTTTYLNDIALLKLSEKISLNDKVQIACLPQSDFVLQSNSKAYAFGWGRTDPVKEDSASDVLRTVSVTVYEERVCEHVGNEKNWSLQICAGDVNGQKDTCQGDSGGPLFINSNINGEDKLLLVGVTSYGDGCANKDKPGIYVRVSGYIDWINSKL